MQENPTVWLFDLDNTLHDADAGIFTLINRAMTRYMARRLKLSESAASDLRQDYWHRYGATLAGLQIHHPEIDIAEFLRESHPIDAILTRLHGMPETQNTLSRLKGRKAVFSNGPSFYVRAVVGALGLENRFAALFGTDDFGLLYKPNPQAYLNVCRLLDVPPECCIMVDDSADNLHQAKALGMKTVRFGAKAHDLPFIDASVSDMAQLARYAETLSEHRQNHYNTHTTPENTKECYA
ncbi:TPA: pyrimidine 5'-nucleotidase [Neisseria meningitidis]